MNEMSVVPLAATLLNACPEVLLFSVAVVLAVARWNQHPRVSMYVASGAGILILTRLFSNVLLMTLSQRRSPEELGTLMPVVGVVSAVLHTIGIGLLIAAAFVDRAPSRER